MDNPMMREVSESSYLYAERTSPMEPVAIKAAMGSAFREVWDYMQAAAIKVAGPAISVYPTLESNPLTFRAGFVIKPEDSAKADDNVRADVTPAGSVMHTLHVGPYSNLGERWEALMADVERLALVPCAPCWELYINDPDTTPTDDLRTELFLSVQRQTPP